MSYKFRIHLIPSTAYGQNMRKKLKSSEWLSLSAYVRDIEVCAGCHKHFPLTKLEAHEEWSFKNGKQKLKHIVPLCKKCHRAVHIGRALHAGKFKKASKRLMKYGKLSESEFYDFYNNAWSKRNYLSKFKYRLTTSKKKAWKIAKKDKEQLTKILKKLSKKQKSKENLEQQNL